MARRCRYTHKTSAKKAYLKRTIRTPRTVTLVFLVLALLCILVFLFHPGNEGASPGPARHNRELDASNNSENRRPDSPDRNAIVTTLVNDSQRYVEDLCRSVGSLKHLISDHESSPVVVFSAKPANQRLRSYLADCTNRTLYYSTDSKISDRAFWTSKVFTSSALTNYDTIMRLEAGACWKEDSDLPHLPGLPNATIVYHSGTELKVNQDTCGSLLEFAKQYIVENHVVVQNPHWWYELDLAWKQRKTCLALETYFEVVRLRFLQQENVQRWLQLAMEQDTKWTDQLLRSFTIAMFAPFEGVIPVSKTYPKGYFFSRGKPGLSCRSLQVPPYSDLATALE